MKTVWKFDLAVDDDVVVELPKGAEILHVDDQDGNPATVQMWARVDPDMSRETISYAIRGTGHPDAEGDHVGSVITAGGALVWHVFRRDG